MARTARALLVVGVILMVVAGPALAQNDQEPLIDIYDFINLESVAQWEDRNDDGIPDMPLEGPDGDVPEGIPGIWDDAIGATTPEEFMERVDLGEGFDLTDTGATLVGPCGGLVIAYGADGNSIDAAVDLADPGPPIDLNGNPAFTEGNPFKVDTGGTLAYFGFTPDNNLSEAGNVLAPEQYGDPNKAFHDHKWEVVVMGISFDSGGDPNQRDKNRNAGISELGELLPFEFRAKVKAKGVMVDLWAPQDLPEYDGDNVAATFAGHEYCFGEGWVEFQGDGPIYYGAAALGAALAAAGFAGLLFNARPALSWRAP